MEGPLFFVSDHGCTVKRRARDLFCGPQDLRVEGPKQKKVDCSSSVVLFAFLRL